MEEFKGKRLFLYNLSTAGWVLLDSIWLTFAIAFLLPPKEKIAEGMIPFISNERFLGVITVLGAVMLFGRIVDAVADPLIASWTDRSTSRFGRRKFFLIIGGLPLAISTVFLFFPPTPSTSFINGIYLAILGALLLYAAVFAVDEKRFSNAKPSQVPLMDSFRKTVRNKAFIIYLFANISLWFLFNIVRSSAIPIVITLMGSNEVFASNMFTVLFVIAAICFPLVGFLTRIRGKKAIMIISLGLYSIFSILLSLTGIVPVNPKLWGLVVVGLMGLPTAVLMIIPNVILSELCDVDYKKTGERREAMYFGVQGFFMKLNLGLSTASLALLYSIFGKDISNPLGVRLAPVLGSIVALLGLIIMTRYPEKQIKELLSK